MGEVGIVILSIGFMAMLVFLFLLWYKDNKKLWGILAGVASLFVIIPVIIMAIAPSAHEVSTAEEFLKIGEYAQEDANRIDFSEDDCKVVLTADIDFEGIEYKAIDASYYTILVDGNGHTVKNISYTTYEEDSDFGVGLFKGYVILSNITFENVTINYQGQTSAVGGIAGRIFEDREFKNVTITGKINAPNAENVGGFIGSTVNSKWKDTSYRLGVENCVSSMEIIGKTNVGGVIGSGKLNAQNSKNTGEVKGKDNVGGVVGKASGDVRGAENYGRIESKGIAGGIVGYAEKQSMISNCKNGAEVVGATQTGGIVGVLGENATVDGCLNLREGKVTAISKDSDGNAKVGGIAGKTEKNSKVYSCTNQGEVLSAYSKVGGIVGYSLGGVTNCKHEGSVTGANDVGGIIGHMKNNSMVSTCIVTGTVTGAVRVGGIMGRFGADDFRTNLKSELGLNDITIMNCSVSGELTANAYGGGLIGLIVNDTIDGEYLETNTFDGTLMVGGVESTNLWVVEVQD